MSKFTACLLISYRMSKRLKLLNQNFIFRSFEILDSISRYALCGSILVTLCEYKMSRCSHLIFISMEVNIAEQLIDNALNSSKV